MVFAHYQTFVFCKISFFSLWITIPGDFVGLVSMKRQIFFCILITSPRGSKIRTENCPFLIVKGPRSGGVPEFLIFPASLQEHLHMVRFLIHFRGISLSRPFGGCPAQEKPNALLPQVPLGITNEPKGILCWDTHPCFKQLSLFWGCRVKDAPPFLYEDSPHSSRQTFPEADSREHTAVRNKMIGI